MQKFDSAHAEYGVILAEKHPEVEFRSSNVKQTVDIYLWYPYELNIHPSTFVEYHKEKLAITDSGEALHLIDMWNDAIHNNKIKKVKFSKVLKIGGINFGVIEQPNSSNVIVMMDRAVGFPRQKTILAGSGGKAWQYLEPVIKPTHQGLKNKFNLNKIQREQFIKKW